VQVAAGQFLHVVTEKKGVDVVVLLADPRGTPVVAAGSANGSANGKFGPEPISLVAGGGGDYQVQVLRVTRSSETGRYCIELTDLRAPTERDRIRRTGRNGSRQSPATNERPPFGIRCATMARWRSACTGLG
jgi:hypothetical protein